MVTRHSRDAILDGAVSLALADGLSLLTFGRLARSLGMNDRTIVYYFPTKGDLIAAVVGVLGGSLQEVLAAAFTAPAAHHLDLARAAWPVLTRSENERVFALLFEANGLAAAGQAPYDTLAPQIIEAWAAWMSGFLTGVAEHRRAEAEAALALIDGLMLLRQLAGAAAATRAAERLGLA